MPEKIKNKIGYLVLAALVLAAIFVWTQAQAGPASPDKIAVDFFDVGQGSAIFVNAANGNQVLIDGGPSDAILAKLGEALPYFDRRIELVILTHPDADHLSGLIEVARRFEIGEILETGIIDSSSVYQTWQKLIADKKIPIVFARAGQRVLVADNLVVDILHPFASIVGQDFSNNTNGSSIVGKIIFGQNKILFTGDAEGSVENPLVLSGTDLKADILVAGHHGSRTSTSQSFLDTVLPRAIVIQVGVNNKYGHPHSELLARLKGLTVWRTDLDGDIKFVCDLAKCSHI